jgi:hypothetical protein
MSPELFATSFIQAFATRRVIGGYMVLGDRETGKALGVTLWQSEADRERSDEKARQIGPRVEQATGGPCKRLRDTRSSSLTFGQTRS